MTSQGLDDPLIGVRAIGRAAKIFDKDGKVDMRAVYYALEHRRLDADKFGRKWITTLRRLRKAWMGEEAADKAA